MNYKLLYILFIFIGFVSCKTVNLTETERRYLLKDSSEDKYYLINLIRERQKNETIGESPALFINDEFVADCFKKMKEIKIKKSDIHRIEILEKEKSVKLFGARGKNGFIKIWTHGPKEILP